MEVFVLIAVVLLGLGYGFLNGFHDSANIAAPLISTRALRPRTALLWVALGEFLGPLIFGSAVAKTIGADLLESSAITPTILAAALIGAIVWDIVTWWFGIPSSSSHALVGGLLGSAIIARGVGVVKFAGLESVLLALFISPFLGFLAGYLITKFNFVAFHNASPRIQEVFRRGQLFTAIGLAMSHGANDSQKTMGVLTLALLVSGHLHSFEVPFWVVVLSGGALALGSGIGGWRLIVTLGARVFRIRPVHGFSSQVGSALVIGGASLLGGPVSTTHVMTSSLMGSGAAERINKVRWQIAGDMLYAWVLTIPISGLVAAGFYILLNALGLG
ncbi:MAG: inorganic phosphate transporter [Chloroflexi bacterium]|nr:inorganic phosphate transporter [Chloroflexota bacterium]